MCRVAQWQCGKPDAGSIPAPAAFETRGRTEALSAVLLRDGTANRPVANRRYAVSPIRCEAGITYNLLRWTVATMESKPTETD